MEACDIPGHDMMKDIIHTEGKYPTEKVAKV
jgi:hypothetical protein